MSLLANLVTPLIGYAQNKGVSIFRCPDPDTEEARGRLKEDCRSRTFPRDPSAERICEINCFFDCGTKEDESCDGTPGAPTGRRRGTPTDNDWRQPDGSVLKCIDCEYSDGYCDPAICNNNQQPQDSRSSQPQRFFEENGGLVALSTEELELRRIPSLITKEEHGLFTRVLNFLLGIFGLGPPVELSLAFVENVANATEDILAQKITADILKAQGNIDGAQKVQDEISKLAQNLKTNLLSVVDFDQQKELKEVTKQVDALVEAVDEDDPKAIAKITQKLGDTVDKVIRRQEKAHADDPDALSQLADAKPNPVQKIPTTKELSFEFINLKHLNEQLAKVWIISKNPGESATANISLTGKAGGRRFAGEVKGEPIERYQARPVQANAPEDLTAVIKMGGIATITVTGTGATFIDINALMAEADAGAGGILPSVSICGPAANPYRLGTYSKTIEGKCRTEGFSEWAAQQIEDEWLSADAQCRIRETESFLPICREICSPGTPSHSGNYDAEAANNSEGNCLITFSIACTKTVPNCI